MTTEARTRVPATVEVSEADLNIKSQVSMSLPMGLIFKLEDAAPKSEKGEALVGTLCAGIIAERFGYTLPKGRNRAKMSDAEKKAKTDAAAAEKKSKLAALKERYRNSR